MYCQSRLATHPGIFLEERQQWSNKWDCLLGPNVESKADFHFEAKSFSKPGFHRWKHYITLGQKGNDTLRNFKVNKPYSLPSIWLLTINFIYALMEHLLHSYIQYNNLLPPTPRVSTVLNRWNKKLHSYYFDLKSEFPVALNVVAGIYFLVNSLMSSASHTNNTNIIHCKDMPLSETTSFIPCSSWKIQAWNHVFQLCFLSYLWSLW